MTSVSVLRCAEGVAFARISPAGFRILAALDHATQVVGRDLIITAGTNDHTSGPHVRGEAYDVRTKDLDVPTILKLKTRLEAMLGMRFTVLYETPFVPTDPDLKRIAYVNGDATGEHLHIQPLKGSTYPPTVEDAELRA